MAGRRSLGVETISISHDDPLRDLFEACKHGDVSRVRNLAAQFIGNFKFFFQFCPIQVRVLVTPQNVNARDTAGRKSSPLHFAAGSCIMSQNVPYASELKQTFAFQLEVDKMCFT